MVLQKDIKRLAREAVSELPRVDETTASHTHKTQEEKMKLINGILKYEDCPHCGNEWEYQCFECEKEELNKLEHLEGENKMNDSTIAYFKSATDNLTSSAGSIKSTAELLKIYNQPNNTLDKEEANKVFVERIQRSAEFIMEVSKKMNAMLNEGGK